MCKKASAALSKSASVFLLLVLSQGVRAQKPDYRLGEWVEDQFSLSAKPFFHQVVLQSGYQLLTGSGKDGRIVLNSSGSVSAAFSDNTLMNKTGFTHFFSGLYRVSPNLWLGGLFSGFRAGEDVIILSGYAAEMIPGGDTENSKPWSIEVSRRNLEGADDFSLKTVSVTLSRRINFGKALLLYGIGSAFFNVNVHAVSPVDGNKFKTRMEGQVNALSGGVEYPFGDLISGLKVSLSGQGASIMLNLGTVIN